MAWLTKLDTEALNKQFYKRLFEWFEYAVDECTFPKKENKVLPPEEHVIRLITRLMFVWFMKEKGLVSERLFNEQEIKKLLKNYDLNQDDSYYRAILQNLFFATLNTKIRERRFSKVSNTHIITILPATATKRRWPTRMSCSSYSRKHLSSMVDCLIAWIALKIRLAKGIILIVFLMIQNTIGS